MDAKVELAMAAALGTLLAGLGTMAVIRLILVQFDVLCLALSLSLPPLAFAILHDVVLTISEMKGERK